MNLGFEMTRGKFANKNEAVDTSDFRHVIMYYL